MLAARKRGECVYDDDGLTRKLGANGGGRAEGGGIGDGYGDGCERLMAEERGGEMLIAGSGRQMWSVHVLGDVTLLNRTVAMHELVYEPYPYAN